MVGGGSLPFGNFLEGALKNGMRSGPYKTSRVWSTIFRQSCGVRQVSEQWATRIIGLLDNLSKAQRKTLVMLASLTWQSKASVMGMGSDQLNYYIDKAIGTLSGTRLEKRSSTILTNSRAFLETWFFTSMKPYTMRGSRASLPRQAN